MRSTSRLLFSMLLFGTIGLFVQAIPLASAPLAMLRAVIGCACLLLVSGCTRCTIRTDAVRACIVPLLLSGACVGLNWVFLFESYRYTTVATATLCYYLAPTLAVLGATLFYRERLRWRQIVCAVAALVGMVLVSGVAGGTSVRLRGVLYGVVAAVLYASVMLLGRKTASVPARDKTILQLGTAALVLLPYCALTGHLRGLFSAMTDVRAWVLLLIVGVVHTGLAYLLYFDGIGGTSPATAAALSYLDPVTAVLWSALLLREPLTPATVAGCVLILGAAVVGEWRGREKTAQE